MTGAAGFIGAHAIEYLQENTDWDIVGLASFRHRGDPLRAWRFSHRTTLLHADLTAPIGPRLAAEIGLVDYVWHFAAESHVDRSIAEPRPFIENNVSVTITMLEYARLTKPRVFVQVSTDEVYGPAPRGTAHKEWSAHVPSNPYSASKAAQEAIAVAYWRTYGVPVAITSTMNNIGERQDPEKFVPMVIRKVAAGEVVPIHGTPGNIGSRFYLHAQNHADAIRFLCERPVAMYPAMPMPDKYNVVGEQEIDNLALAQRIAEIIGKPLRYELIDFHSARPGHDARYALDGSKLAALGWKAPVPLDEALVRMVNWTLNHPEWRSE